MDWYLTAHARSGPLSASKSDQDFLLQAGDPTGSIALGDKEVARTDLPARSFEGPSPAQVSLKTKAGNDEPTGLRSKLGCLVGPLAALLFLAIGLLLDGSIDWNPLLVIGVPSVTLVLLAVAAGALIGNAYKRKLDLGQVWVRPAIVRGGSEIRCHVDFVAKRRFHLSSIMASITARERITRTAGTATVTEVHLLDEKTYTRPFDEDLPEGRWIAFDCTLPVSSDAPATFTSKNNNLEWAVTMKAALRGWPAWQKTFPVTVLP